MGITVRQARHGNLRNRDKPRNWLVRTVVADCGNNGPCACRRTVRTYTCTNWTDAMRIADDLANERTIDPWRVIALSERRV